MADITITAANVISSVAQSARNGIAGAAITAGQALYKDPSDGTLKLCDSNAGAPANVLLGISLNNAAIGQPVAYVTSDPSLTIGGTVAAGATVCVSSNPGGVCPDADVVTGDFKTVIGVGIGSNKINMSPISAGVAT